MSTASEQYQQSDSEFCQSLGSVLHDLDSVMLMLRARYDRGISVISALHMRRELIPNLVDEVLIIIAFELQQGLREGLTKRVNALRREKTLEFNLYPFAIDRSPILRATRES